VLGQRLVNFADDLTGTKHPNLFGVAVVLAVDDAHHVMPFGAHSVVTGAAPCIEKEFGTIGSVGFYTMAVIEADTVVKPEGN